MSKHTPGPWTDDTRIPVYGLHNMALVMAAPKKEMAVAKANARLISSSPDLLACCRAAFPILMYRHQHGDCTCRDDKPCPFADMAAALAKAESERA